MSYISLPYDDRRWIGDPPPRYPWQVDPNPWPLPSVPTVYPSVPNRTTITTTGPTLDFKSKREKNLEELLRMAVDELLTGDEDAWALAELIEEALSD